MRSSTVCAPRLAVPTTSCLDLTWLPMLLGQAIVRIGLVTERGFEVTRVLPVSPPSANSCTPQIDATSRLQIPSSSSSG